MPQRRLTVLNDGCCGCVTFSVVVEDSDVVREVSGSRRCGGLRRSELRMEVEAVKR